MKFKGVLLYFFVIVLFASIASADERLFTYSYESSVLPEGAIELEQWVTNQSGKEDGDYSEWNLRTEFEFGITEAYMTALYLNLDSVRSEGVTGVEDEDGADFNGISWENVYQLSNPKLDPIGSALYGEVSTDGLDTELEWKLLLSKEFSNNIVAAFNAVYEMEWEKEDGETEEEAGLEFTAGLAYKLSPKWAAGIEVRNKSAYPGGLDLKTQEYQTWSVGPNIHYGNPKWWFTFTVLPQVWGNGDGAQSDRNLVHEESIEFRLIAGVPLA